MFNVKKLHLNSSHDLIVVISSNTAKKLKIFPKEKVLVTCKKNKKQIYCDVQIFDCDIHCNLDLSDSEIGLYELAFSKLECWDNAEVTIAPAPKAKSINYVKRKFEGKGRINSDEMREIVLDIVENKYSVIEKTYFVLAGAAHPFDDREVMSLTNAMVGVGKTLDFKKHKHDVIVDKHCIGGVPNNRTTMIVIPIISSLDLKIPKTSSRSITSPAGTADTMEVLADVNLSLSKMYDIVEKHNGCIAWGGSLDLSPADDVIIEIEHPLEIDCEGQMIASILSKKKSAGSTHVLIDIPVGKGAKVETLAEGKRLLHKFESIGSKVGLNIKCIITDGREPVGNGIGPYLEAMDVLKVLQNDKDAPEDLKEKSLIMAGKILEFSGSVDKGKGYEIAKKTLESGIAHDKFEEIILAQGKKMLPNPAKYTFEFKSGSTGTITDINNKLVSKLAFLLGAPSDKAAGLYFNKKREHNVKKNETIFVLHSNSKLKLEYGKQFLKENSSIVIIS